MINILDELEELFNLAYKNNPDKADYYMSRLIGKITNCVTNYPKRPPCLCDIKDEEGYDSSCEEIMCDNCFNFYSSPNENDIFNKDILNTLISIQTNNRPRI